jgi:hypothetical protein
VITALLILYILTTLSGLMLALASLLNLLSQILLSYVPVCEIPVQNSACNMCAQNQTLVQSKLKDIDRKLSIIIIQKMNNDHPGVDEVITMPQFFLFSQLFILSDISLL